MHRSLRPSRILLSALFLVVAGIDSAAAQPVTATSGSPGAIARIRAEFAEIERGAPGYRRTEHDLYNFSLEGGVLYGFYRGSERRKLSARLFGETWRGSEEYYFANGRLIFIYVVRERYHEPFGEVRARMEHRYYFDGGRLIRYVRTQHPANVGEDMSAYDPELEMLLRNARLFTACAAAPASPDRPECTAPEM